MSFPRQPVFPGRQLFCVHLTGAPVQRARSDLAEATFRVICQRQVSPDTRDAARYQPFTGKHSLPDVGIVPIEPHALSLLAVPEGICISLSINARRRGRTCIIPRLLVSGALYR